jgi:hypothetical protein
MAQHGGKRPGAGRKPGKVSKAKRELSDMAKEHAPEALKTLRDIMRNDQEPAAARVSAANTILDRGHGKAPQALTGPDGGPVQHEVRRVEIVAADDDCKG